MPITPFRLGGTYAVVAVRFQGHHANKWLSQFLIVCVIICASFVETPAFTHGEEKILLLHMITAGLRKDTQQYKEEYRHIVAYRQENVKRTCNFIGCVP
jgi:hypothetical protein